MCSGGEGVGGTGSLISRCMGQVATGTSLQCGRVRTEGPATLHDSIKLIVVGLYGGYRISETGEGGSG